MGKYFRSLCSMQIHTSEVSEVKLVQLQQLGCIDNIVVNKNWRKRVTQLGKA